MTKGEKRSGESAGLFLTAYDKFSTIQVIFVAEK